MCSNSELDPCGEDMIPLSFYTVKPDGQAQIVPNQSVKASYATDSSDFLSLMEGFNSFHTISHESPTKEARPDKVGSHHLQNHIIMTSSILLDTLDHLLSHHCHGN